MISGAGFADALGGDGNLLMNLGILAQVGALRPANFVHCVFDNEVYVSTGNQRSPSCAVRRDAPTAIRDRFRASLATA